MKLLNWIRRRYPCFLRSHDFRYNHRKGNLRIYHCERCTATMREFRP